MADRDDKADLPLRLIKPPHLSMYVLLDEELLHSIQEAQKTQQLLTTTYQGTDLWHSAQKELKYLREDVGTRLIWQFTEALRSGA